MEWNTQDFVPKSEGPREPGKRHDLISGENQPRELLESSNQGLYSNKRLGYDDSPSDETSDESTCALLERVSP